MNKPQPITYDEWMKEITPPTPIRPPCPECGSTHTVSNGPQWLCGECGKQWIKRNQARKQPDYENRPACPECGAKRATSHSLSWVCGACGRSWIDPDKARRKRCLK